MDQEKKRLSILKKSTRYEQSPGNTVTKSLRRISFSGTKSVKEFIAGNNEATIWGTSYEEEDANHASALSVRESSNIDLPAAASHLNVSGMMLRNRKVIGPSVFSEVDKENVARVANDTMELTNSVNIASSFDNRTFDGTVDITLNTFELKNFKFNRAALYTQMKESAKAGSNHLNDFHPDEAMGTPTDLAQSFYCSFITEKDRGMLRNQRKNIVDEPNRFHSELDQLKFDDSQVGDAESGKDNKNYSDDDMDVSFEGSLPGKLSECELISKEKIQHEGGISDRPFHNTEVVRKTIVFHKELSKSDAGILNSQTDTEKSIGKRHTIMHCDEEIDIENITPKSQELEVKSNLKRKTIIFQKGEEIEDALDHNLLCSNAATNNVDSNYYVHDMSILSMDETNKNSAAMVDSRVKSRPTQIFENGEKVDEVLDQMCATNQSERLHSKARHTLVFNNGERIDEVVCNGDINKSNDKRKTCIFSGEDIDIDENKDNVQSQAPLVTANAEETHKKIVASESHCLKQSGSKIPSSIVKITKFSFKDHARKTLIFPSGGEDIRNDFEEPRKADDKPSSFESVFYPNSSPTLYFNEQIKGAGKEAPTDNSHMDGFFEFPPSTEKSIAGNNKKSTDYVFKTRRDTILTEGNMDERNISVEEKLENTSLRMFPKIEEGLSTAQKLDIVRSNVNESETEKINNWEEQERRANEMMDLNQSKLQAPDDIFQQQASINKDENIPERRGTIFFHEDNGMDFDLADNESGCTKHERSKESLRRQKFQTEIQSNRHNGPSIQTFGDENIDEVVDNIGTFEQPLDKIRLQSTSPTKDFRDDIFSSATSLVGTTFLPTKSRSTLFFKNGEPIESETESFRNEIRQVLENKEITEAENVLYRNETNQTKVQRKTRVFEGENMEIESNLDNQDQSTIKNVTVGNDVTKTGNGNEKTCLNESFQIRHEISSISGEDFDLCFKQPRVKTIDSVSETTQTALQSHACKDLVFHRNESMPFQLEVQVKRNMPQSVEIFVDESLNEAADKFGNCEQPLDKIRSQSILHYEVHRKGASLPVVPLPRATSPPTKSRSTLFFKNGEPIVLEGEMFRSDECKVLKNVESENELQLNGGETCKENLQRKTCIFEAENMEIEDALNEKEYNQKPCSDGTFKKRRNHNLTSHQDFDPSFKEPRIKTIDSILESAQTALQNHAHKRPVFHKDEEIQQMFDETQPTIEGNRSKAIVSVKNVRQTVISNDAIGRSTEANVGTNSRGNRKTILFSDHEMDIDQCSESFSLSGREVRTQSSDTRMYKNDNTILQEIVPDETPMIVQKNTSNVFALTKGKNPIESNSLKSADNDRILQGGYCDGSESPVNISTNSGEKVTGEEQQLRIFRNVIVPNSTHKLYQPVSAANKRKTVIFNKESILEDAFGSSFTHPPETLAGSHFLNRNPAWSQSNSVKNNKRRETILVPVEMDETTDCLEKVVVSKASKTQNEELKSNHPPDSVINNTQVDYTLTGNIEANLNESQQSNQPEVKNSSRAEEISTSQRKDAEQSVNLSSPRRSAAPGYEDSYTQRPNRGTFVIYKDNEYADESHETSQVSERKVLDNSCWTAKDIQPRLFRKSTRDSMYLSRTAQCPLIPGSLHTTTSSADFSANTTAALCNIDPNCITGTGYKRSFNKNYAAEDTFYKQLKYNDIDRIKLEIDGIKEDYDDIDKTQIDLVDSTLLDTSEKGELCEASVMIVEVMESKGPSANFRKSIVMKEQEKSLCRKCKNCQRTILSDTTLEGFSLEQDEENVVINFDALNRLKGKPRFSNVLREFKERRLSNCFNSTYEDSVLLPSVPSTEFLLKNYSEEYMQKIENESQLNNLVPAIYPVVRPFEFLFRNRLETEKCNWNFNDFNLPVGILECHHRTVRSIHLIIKFNQQDLYKSNAGQLKFSQVSMRKSNLYKNPSTFEKLVQNEIFLRVPCDLTAYCSSSADLFTFLESVDNICDKSYQLAKRLLKVIFSNHGTLQCNESGNCIVKKVVYIESNAAVNGTRMKFLIRVRNIEKMCSDDILMPPRSYFKDHVKSLPNGLEFFNKFLKSPVEYLR